MKVIMTCSLCAPGCCWGVSTCQAPGLRSFLPWHMVEQGPPCLPFEQTGTPGRLLQQRDRRPTLTIYLCVNMQVPSKYYSEPNAGGCGGALRDTLHQ
jgi:hypothetical protein